MDPKWLLTKSHSIPGSPSNNYISELCDVDGNWWFAKNIGGGRVSYRQHQHGTLPSMPYFTNSPYYIGALYGVMPHG